MQSRRQFGAGLRSFLSYLHLALTPGLGIALDINSILPRPSQPGQSPVIQVRGTTDIAGVNALTRSVMPCAATLHWQLVTSTFHTFRFYGANEARISEFTISRSSQG